MYSRKNTQKLMSICNAVDGLLDSKDRMDSEIEKMIQSASDCLEIALVKMQLEAAIFAKGREEDLMKSPMFPGLYNVEVQEFEAGHVISMKQGKRGE